MAQYNIDTSLSYFLFYFWNYNIIVSFLPFFPPLQTLLYTPPYSFKFMTSFSSLTFVINIYAYIYINIYIKCNWLRMFNMPYMYAFRTDHLVLANCLVKSFLKKTISATLTISWKPIVFLWRVKDMWAFLYWLQHLCWDSCSAQAMLMRLYGSSLLTTSEAALLLVFF